MPESTDLSTDLEVDAALARTYRRHDVLHRQRAARRRWGTGGLFAIVVVAAVVVVPRVASSDPDPTLLPADGRVATTTTLDPDGKLPAPAGYTLSERGDVWALERVRSTERSPQGTGSPPVAASSTVSERSDVTRFGPGPVRRSVSVELECITPLARVESVAYRLEADRIVVDAVVGYDPGSPPCSPGERGPQLNLPLPAPLPVGATVVAGSIRTP